MRILAEIAKNTDLSAVPRWHRLSRITDAEKRIQERRVKHEFPI